MWKCASMLTGFWIKQKFQDTFVHHYITNPDSGALDPLLAPHRKDYRLSRLCGRSQGEKHFACTNEGYIEPRVKLSFVTIRLPSRLFYLHDSSTLHVGLLDFHIILHWLQQYDSWYDSTRRCWYVHSAGGVHVELQCSWVMSVLLVAHSFTFAW